MFKPIMTSPPTGPFGHGYMICRARYSNGKVRTVTYHRFLYEVAFGELPDRSFHVHHKNGDKLDNRLENLEAVHYTIHNKLHTQPDCIKQLGLVDCTCFGCTCTFKRDRWSVNQSLKHSVRLFCSRTCFNTVFTKKGERGPQKNPRKSGYKRGSYKRTATSV